jgi:hypothetical protein
MKTKTMISVFTNFADKKRKGVLFTLFIAFFALLSSCTPSESINPVDKSKLRNALLSGNGEWNLTNTGQQTQNGINIGFQIDQRRIQVIKFNDDATSSLKDDGTYISNTYYGSSVHLPNYIELGTGGSYYLITDKSLTMTNSSGVNQTWKIQEIGANNQYIKFSGSNGTGFWLFK